MLLALLSVLDAFEKVFVVFAELLDRLFEVLHLLLELSFLGEALLY